MSEERERARDQGTISAAEVDVDGQSAADPQSPVEVVVGEIPNEHDTTSMLWTARCRDPQHDLLGRFPTREEAERARTLHLEDEHREELHGHSSPT